MDYFKKYIFKNSCCPKLFFIFLALLNKGFGQQLFKYENNIDIGIKNKYSDSRSPLHFGCKENLYFTNYEYKNLKKLLSTNDSTLTIYKFTTNTRKTSKVTCNFKGIIGLDFFIQYGLKSFTFSEDEKTVLLNFYDHVLIFKRAKYLNYEFASFFVKPYAYESIVQISEEEFLLFQIYNYTDISDSERVVVSKYNIKKNKIVKHLKLHLNGIEYSHLTHKWFDVTNQYFAIANSLNYSITFYSFNFDSIYTINRESNMWIRAEDSIINSIYNNFNLKNTIENLHELDAKISRIEKIYFIGNENLLISYKHPGDNSNTRRIDLWEKKDRGWIPQKLDVIVNTTSLLDLGDTLYYSNRSFPEITYSSDLYFYNKKGYFIQQFYCPDCNSCLKNEYSKNCREYIDKHGNNFGVVILEIN